MLHQVVGIHFFKLQDQVKCHFLLGIEISNQINIHHSVVIRKIANYDRIVFRIRDYGQLVKYLGIGICNN